MTARCQTLPPVPLDPARAHEPCSGCGHRWSAHPRTEAGCYACLLTNDDGDDQ